MAPNAALDISVSVADAKSTAAAFNRVRPNPAPPEPPPLQPLARLHVADARANASQRGAPSAGPIAREECPVESVDRLVCERGKLYLV